MALNDVWRSFEKDIGIFHKGRFDAVPESAGVYAWFYPLRLASTDLDEFLNDVNRVLSFDASVNGIAERDVSADFAWESIALRAQRLPRYSPLPRNVSTAWANVVEDSGLFGEFQRIILRASVLMPPLYVGKTVNLRVRCSQHIEGRGPGNDFHKRYEGFAAETGVRARQVRDLIFVVLRTGGSSSPAADVNPLEDIVEEVMKRLCRPVYSFK